jgi:hypothetical protein
MASTDIQSPALAVTNDEVSKTSSVAELRATLAQLSQREAAVTARLDTLIASQKDLSRELGRLDLLRGHLGTQVVNARSISNSMLSEAATTAKHISGAVERLDMEQANVNATLRVVEQVAELKDCVLGVNGSMGAPQDWETAAGYIHRSSKIPSDVIDGRFAEEMVPTAEVPDPPRVTLNNAAESLCGLFLREFDKAAKEGDGAKVTRFFKLFPLVGRSSVGLEAYGRYVCHGVASRARLNISTASGQHRDGYFYANALTKLFEHIAQIIDGHQPLVEKHYGVGMMGKVIERLQIEADVQGGIILDSWHEERKIERTITDIKSYAFSFLVQSFLQTSRSNLAPSRTASPAFRDGNADSSPDDDGGVDMKVVDGLLGESALMLGRWSLYTRFLATKCSSTSDVSDDVVLQMPSFLLNSNLMAKVSSILVEPFNIMTTFYFRRSVEKAFQLDEAPADLSLNPNKTISANPPFITSSVDDIMYIVNQVLQRCLSTSQRPVVASVVPTIGRVLESDFVGMVHRKMRDECLPRAAVPGALPPEDKTLAFLVLINNLDIAMDYIKRIITNHVGDSPATDTSPGVPKLTRTGDSNILMNLFPFPNEALYVNGILKNMALAFESKTTELFHDSINTAFFLVLKPRVRPTLADAFRDIDYGLSQSELASLRDHGAGTSDSHSAGIGGSQDDDVVKTRFTRAWNALIRPLARILTPRAFDRLLNNCASCLAEALEKRMWGYYGRVNELGAQRLERDISAVISATVQGGRFYSLRDAFQRCVQIGMIMNMEEEEWEEVKRDGDDPVAGGVEWVLDRSERVRARGIVKDRGFGKA